MDDFGVYVHVPFCATRCDYCAFATWTDRHHLMASYVSACIAELSRAADAGMPPATSVFFGGGTPSLLPPNLLGRLVDAIPRRPDAEVTVECNPDTVDPLRLAGYRDCGVNRLSLGVQSMDPAVLSGLGRTHDPASVDRAVEALAGAGFVNYNVDLIFGGFGESDPSWRATLQAVLALEPSPVHVSAYALTVEAGTALAADPSRHPDDDIQAGRYLIADEVLTDAGLAWYEISNWARPGFECRHNLLYWRGGDYRGIGCAAHSHVGGRRWWNMRTPERYIQAVTEGASPVAGEELLDADGRELEALQLALRTRSGVPSAALGTELEGDLVYRDGDRAVLTPRGRLLANEVSLRLRATSGWPK